MQEICFPKRKPNIFSFLLAPPLPPPKSVPLCTFLSAGHSLPALQCWQGCSWYLGSYLSCELSLKSEERNQLPASLVYAFLNGFWLAGFVWLVVLRGLVCWIVLFCFSELPLLCPACLLSQVGMSCSSPLSLIALCRCRMASFWPQACMCTAAVLTVLAWAPSLTGT